MKSDIPGNWCVIVWPFVGEFTLSVIVANWELHTKLVVIRTWFALFHLAALHCGESEAFCLPPMGVLWSSQAGDVAEMQYHSLCFQISFWRLLDKLELIWRSGRCLCWLGNECVHSCVSAANSVKRELTRAKDVNVHGLYFSVSEFLGSCISQDLDF